MAHGQHTATGPVTALDVRLALRGTDAGRLLTSLCNTVVTADPISGEAISIVVRKRARAPGLPAERITAHSLRAGHATSAALAGVALDRIAAQTRHKHVSTLLERYIRPAQALGHTCSRDLGLKHPTETVRRGGAPACDMSSLHRRTRTSAPRSRLAADAVGALIAAPVRGEESHKSQPSHQ